ncbi:MAG: hypothetical protein KKF46_04885 [Nanoarchaeota archaeon]|nr:hypothetical protein [Nanoarchaeota archaeon]MBU1321668.1 hypothetical protein [Nanoarchaeota archaeon]MBU1598420.1 hypothetical protein [Nanoarchaeota archaeon]MBU2441046.1 hypothetical protein [Nanoarchaeota archaeon]
MNKKNLKFEELEDAKFTIEKEAFKPKTLICSKCNIRMKRSDMNISFKHGVSLELLGFECSRCKKRYLDLAEARKLDRALIMSRIMGADFKLERSLSFDGDNFTFRIPKEFTRDVHKKKIEIMPLGAKEFCALIR